MSDIGEELHREARFLESASTRDYAKKHPFEPAEEPPELSDALDAWLESAMDDLQARAMDIAVMESPKSYMMLQHREAAAKRLRDARAALVALFDRQREANLELWSPRSLVAKLEAEVASLSSQLEAQQEKTRMWREAYQQGASENQSLSSQLERLTGERSLIGELYVEVTSALQECCQRHKLGLGGEQCHALVIAEVERLKAEQSDVGMIFVNEVRERMAKAGYGVSLLGRIYDEAKEVAALRRLSQSDTGDTNGD